MYILQVERNEISATYRASLKVNLEIRGNIFFYLHFSISIDIIDIRWYKSVILQVGKIILENRFDKYRSCEINENKYFVSVFFATDLSRRSIRRWRRRKRKKERERKNTRSRATLDAISLSLSSLARVPHTTWSLRSESGFVVLIVFLDTMFFIIVSY